MEQDGQYSKPTEEYIHDYESAHKKIIEGRTATEHGAFFLPYLHSGMKLLDCGCGPGTITIGYAEVVAPSEVIGIDFEPSQIDIAHSNAAKFGISNIKFETGDVYELPCADNNFDAVFSHGFLPHLKNPVKALKEMYRVLKFGGIVGLRSCDWNGVLIAPANPVLATALELYYKFRQHNGGDPYMGKHQRKLLREAGFVDTKASASYECWGTIEETRSFREVLISELAGPKIAEQATKFGWADNSHFEQTVASLSEWGDHPDSFFAHSWCEAVGWKK